METNKEIALAWEYVRRTSVNVFLTGRAGTGKTTFLHRVVAENPKRKVVVAPTGIAAINAKGMTLHSFFQLPFGVCLPEYSHTQAFDKDGRFRFNKSKLSIIRSLELLIIDEVSMLRCDTMDELDAILRRLRRNERPFGGVQLLMIGDMQQLPPVVKAEEWDMLKQHYASPYFFDSKVLRRNPYISVELKHIYRQRDARFIQLLEAVRQNQLTPPLLEELNSRYVPNIKPSDTDARITLSTHNASAKSINDRRLSQIDAPSFLFRARIVDNFPEHMYPQDETLILKEGAQVMFTKNDPSPEKRFVNGTIGYVSELSDDHIEVCTPTGERIDVDVSFWENLKYKINKETKEIESDIDGLFYQYPLKLAWAITIHKSQGLTFDKVLIDAAHSFSHGQVYVALSRCRTLEGIILQSPLSTSSVISDRLITLFSDEAEKRTPTAEQLSADAKAYFLSQAQSLFDCSEWAQTYRQTSDLVQTALAKLYPLAADEWNKRQIPFVKEIVDVGSRFRLSLTQLVDTDYETNDFLQERLSKAATYFADKADELLLPLLTHSANLDIDAKQTKADFKKHFSDFVACYTLKAKLWRQTTAGFDLTSFLKQKAETEVFIENTRLDALVRHLLPEAAPGKKSSETAEMDILNRALFGKLKAWRKEKAEAMEVPAYVVATQRALIGIANSCPQTDKELLEIKGIGKHFIEHHAEDVLKIINQSKTK